MKGLTRQDYKIMEYTPKMILDMIEQSKNSIAKTNKEYSEAIDRLRFAVEELTKVVKEIKK